MTIAPHLLDAHITPAEREVLLALCAGRTRRQVAAGRVCSFHTVNVLLTNLYARWGVHTTAAAITHAVVVGAITVADLTDADTERLAAADEGA